MRTARYSIGTKFIRYNKKRKVVETVTDIWTTTNSKGIVVEIRYEVELDFMGQIITDYIPASTIARSEIVYTPIDVSRSGESDGVNKLSNFVANDIAYRLQNEL